VRRIDLLFHTKVAVFGTLNKNKHQSRNFSKSSMYPPSWRNSLSLRMEVASASPERMCKASSSRPFVTYCWRQALHHAARWLRSFLKYVGGVVVEKYFHSPDLCMLARGQRARGYKIQSFSLFLCTIDYLFERIMFLSRCVALILSAYPARLL